MDWKHEAGHGPAFLISLACLAGLAAATISPASTRAPKAQPSGKTIGLHNPGRSAGQLPSVQWRDRAIVTNS